MNPILLTFAGNPKNQDRGVVLRDGPAVVLCVADWAGGSGGGAEAANMAVELVRQSVPLLTNADSCANLLRKLDEAIAADSAAGETTCALAVVSQSEVFGASVGDSGVWLIPETGPYIDLTRLQTRKPFIGSGGAWPVPFRQSVQRGSLLLATDGLLKYTSAERILETCRQTPAELAAQHLVQLVAYTSGTLPDDVTLILTQL